MELAKRFSFRLHTSSGIPVYRQMIDQVVAGLATGLLSRGDQLPTVRQTAVDLAINPNTVIRAYRELEVRGILETQQGTGTFISHLAPQGNAKDGTDRLERLIDEMVSRAGAEGFTLRELLAALEGRQSGEEKEGDSKGETV